MCCALKCLSLCGCVCSSGCVLTAKPGPVLIFWRTKLSDPSMTGGKMQMQLRYIQRDHNTHTHTHTHTQKHHPPFIHPTARFFFACVCGRAATSRWLTSGRPSARSATPSCSKTTGAPLPACPSPHPCRGTPSAFKPGSSSRSPSPSPWRPPHPPGPSARRPHHPSSQTMTGPRPGRRNGATTTTHRHRHKHRRPAPRRMTMMSISVGV